MNTSLPRGIRNRNPLNIKFSAVRYAEKITGEQKQDPVFEEFTSLRYGYLAALRLINRYMIQHHCYSLFSIINRWCPNSTNYVEFVCRNTGIGGQDHLTPLDPRLKDVVFWMATMENGCKYVTDEHREAINQAWNDYLQQVILPPNPESRINLKKFQ